MKGLIIILIALLAGASIILIAEYEPGYVMLQYGNWSLETSIIVLSVAFIVLLIAGYMLLRSLVLVKRVPQNLTKWKQTNQHKKANNALTKGLITLEEGRWTEAERLLVRYAGMSETPLLHYLAAARAAQNQQASERRDNYLRLAHETTEGSDIAVGVVQAELQLAEGQQEQALATLQHLREMAPKHPHVLKLLQQLYLDMGQWKEMQEVLPDLRKRRVLDSSETKALAVDVMVGRLHVALNQADWATMEEVWQKSSAKLKHKESALVPYVAGLVVQGKLIQAEKLIEDFQRKQWSDYLVYQYGKLSQGDTMGRLAKAEKWLKGRENNPWLLLTLGRLARMNRLWAKDEEYLRRSLAHGPRGETYQELAEVLSAEGKYEAATEAYQQGLKVMLDQSAPMKSQTVNLHLQEKPADQPDIH